VANLAVEAKVSPARQPLLPGEVSEEKGEPRQPLLPREVSEEKGEPRLDLDILQ